MMSIILALIFHLHGMDASDTASLMAEAERIHQQSRLEGLELIQQTFNLKNTKQLSDELVEQWRCYALQKEQSRNHQNFVELESTILKRILFLRKRVRSRNYINESELNSIEKEANELFAISEKHGCVARGQGPEILVRYLNIPYEIKRRRQAIESSKNSWWHLTDESTQ